MGQPIVTVVTLGCLRAIKGHLRVNIGYNRANIGQLRIVKGHVYFLSCFKTKLLQKHN